MASRSWNYDPTELAADATVHIVGVALAIAGAVTIVAAAFALDDVGTAIATSVYALSLIATLAASAVYSMWPVGTVKWRLRKYDHAAIYILIAGTYTPFTPLMGESGLWLLVWTWSVAAIGIFLKLAFPGRYNRFSIFLYLSLAWSGVLIFDTLTTSLPIAVIWLLLAGGIVYSAGVAFHLWQTLRFHKAIWHGFVFTAALIHYCAVFASVLELGS